MDHGYVKELTEQLEDLLDRLSADLSPTGLRLEAGVYDLARDRWVAGQGPDVLDDFGDDGYVFVLFGRQHLTTEQDGTPDALQILGDVQDWAMDELGHGWPEMCNGAGDFLALLEPAREGDRYVWAARGQARAAVGDLASLRIILPSAPG